MKKDSFEKKLAAYVSMAAAYMAAHPVDANAQILYTNVNPDAVINNTDFYLDLNQDGINDFRLSNTEHAPNNFGQPINACYIFPLGLNRIAGNESFGQSDYPVPIASGNLINAADNFNANAILAATVLYFQYYQYWTSTLTFNEGLFWGTNKIVGLKIINGANAYYGWARLDVNGDQIVLKDYAVKLNPNSGIQVGVVPSCPMPGNLHVTNTTNHSAKLNWNTQSQAIGYTVQYRKAGTSGWLFQYVTTNLGYKNISGLLPNTSYEWRVRTICHQNPLVQSQFTAIQTFTTPLRLEDETVDASVTETQNELFIYPNPATNEIHLLIGEGGDYELKMFNMLGQQMAVEKINLQQDESVTVGTSNLPSGTYQILVTSNEGNFVGRFVKE